MNLQQYNSLCSACDRLLSSADSTVCRVATPWLHVIKPHNEFLKYYKDVFEEKNRKHKLFTIYKEIRQILGHIYSLTKSLINQRDVFHSSADLLRGTDLMIVSHLIDEKLIGDDVDFYYGNLPNEIAKEKIKIVIVLINYTNISASEVARRWKKSAVTRIILDTHVRTKVTAKIIASMLCESLTLRRKVKLATSELEKRIIKMASVEVFSSGTRWALKTAAQLAEVVKNISPSKIMITHEGHSWERVAFSAVRDINPKIFCIGYQHSTIAYLQHALKRDLLPKYNPDFVYTSGATGANLLKRYHQKKTQFLAVLGSPRPIVSRQLILNDSSIVSAQKQFCCLVLPEGIIDECNVLFEFSMKCALQNPSVQFIWRLHPNMSYDEVVRQNPKFKNLPTNIYISNRTFEEDIKKSQISLYRGSTAIIGAVMSGIFPIYLNQPEEISIDTLWELDSNFRCVSTTYEFKNILKSMMLKNKSNQTLSVIRRAQALCQALLLPMDSVQLVKRLKHDDKIATK